MSGFLRYLRIWVYIPYMSMEILTMRSSIHKGAVHPSRHVEVPVDATISKLNLKSVRFGVVAY